ncbi:MAG: YdeI/OmpD-associated family protein, partial [Deltaproteobacteria bacterium]
MTNSKPAELPVRLFTDGAAWEAWLAKQHAKSAGVWLRIAKAASNVKSVSYAEALDVALCYGWIDGQKKTFDDAT